MRGRGARIAAALLLLSLAADKPALAQDCSHATGAVGRAICADVGLLAAEQALDGGYHLMLIVLRDAARDHVIADQKRWREARDRACPDSPQGLAHCVRLRNRDRSVTLAGMAIRTYPFVSERMVITKGSVGGVSYVVDASYPQFDGRTADFAAVNRHFAQRAQERSDGMRAGRQIATPPATTWSYWRSLRLHRPSEHTVGVEAEDYAFTGGAHGNGGTTSALVDLRTGRIVEPAEVFVPGDQWIRTVAGLATPEILWQLKQRDVASSLDEEGVASRLRREPGRLLFRNEALAVHFNRDDIAPYAVGTFTAEVPYSWLRDVLRPGGPLAP